MVTSVAIVLDSEVDDDESQHVTGDDESGDETLRVDRDDGEDGQFNGGTVIGEDDE